MEEKATNISRKMRFSDTGFAVLKNKSFRVLWTGYLFSFFGVWIQNITLAWVVVNQTNSASALGTLLLIQFFPSMLLTLVGGSLADKYPRKQLLLYSQILMLLPSIAISFICLHSPVSLPALYLLVGIVGLAQAVNNPVRQAFIPEVVDKASLPPAIYLNSTAFNIAKIAGPAVGGIMLSVFGAFWTLSLNNLFYLIMILVLFFVKAGQAGRKDTGTGKNMLHEISEGIKFSMQEKRIQLILIIAIFLGTFGYNLNAIVPLVAKFILHTTPAQFGLLTASAGAGSLVAAVLLTIFQKTNLRIVTVGALGFSLSLLLVGLSNSLLIASVCFCLFGFFGIVFFSSSNSLILLLTPKEFQGRVSSIFIFLIIGSTPVGSYLIGDISDLVGVKETILAFGLVCLMSFIVTRLFFMRVKDSPI
ncbi:MAG TPA: MFS transporter [Bacteroidales bacterium]|nr:MFS transporter [Bacteroidales bacterium]